MDEIRIERFAKKIKKQLKNKMQKLSPDEIKSLLNKYDIKPNSKLKLSNIYQLLEEVDWDLLSKEIDPKEEPIIEFKGETYHYSFFQGKVFKFVKKEKTSDKKRPKSSRSKTRKKRTVRTKKDNEIKEEKTKTNKQSKTKKTTETNKKDKSEKIEEKTQKTEKITKKTDETEKIEEKTQKTEKITKKTDEKTNDEIKKYKDTIESSKEENYDKLDRFLEDNRSNFYITTRQIDYIKDFNSKTSGEFNKNMFYRLEETSDEDMEKANERRFKYPPVPEVNIYHACFSDIYFLYEYLPSERRKIYKNQNTHLSKEVENIVKDSYDLLDYKYNRDYVDYYTKKLLKAIKGIFNNYFYDKEGIGLVAIPPSKKNLSPQTKKSIDLIEKWCEEGNYELDFKIYNFSKLLKRTVNVSSSKKGDRTLKKHQNSIKCQDCDIPTNIGLIILDDITTSGNSMYSCKDILIDNGLENEDIICLALARDIYANDELIASDEGVILKENPNVERY